MSTSLNVLVDKIRRHYDDGCFACGRDNPLGLQMDQFTLEDGTVTARFNPRPDYRGSGTTLHGGVTATALDEILVWAGILGERVMSVTGTMDLRFLKRVDVSESVEVRGRVDERRGRRLLVSGELIADGAVRAEATGLYLITASLAEMGLL